MNTIIVPDFTDLLHKYNDKYGDEYFDGYLENFPFSNFKLIVNSNYPIDVIKVVIHMKNDYANVKIVKWDLSKDERIERRYGAKEINEEEFADFKMNYYGQIPQNIIGNIDLEKCQEMGRWEECYWNLSDEISIVLRYIYFELKNRRRTVKEINHKINIENQEVKRINKSKDKKVFLLNDICKYFYLDEKPNNQAMAREIQCPCWSVRGHYRHYKSGRVIFIKEYKKGKKRENTEPKGKTYTT